MTSNSIPRWNTRVMKICVHTTLWHTNVHRSIIHINQKVKTIQMPINWWMYNQNVVYAYNRILISHKNLWTAHTCYNMNVSWKYTLCKKKKFQKVLIIWFYFYAISRICKSIVTEIQLPRIRGKLTGRGS
jgi:hypothetical protein